MFCFVGKPDAINSCKTKQLLSQKIIRVYSGGYGFLPLRKVGEKKNFFFHMGVSKNRGFPPKMDGDNNGSKPYEQMG